MLSDTLEKPTAHYQLPHRFSLRGLFVIITGLAVGLGFLVTANAVDDGTANGFLAGYFSAMLGHLLVGAASGAAFGWICGGTRMAAAIGACIVAMASLLLPCAIGAYLSL